MDSWPSEKGNVREYAAKLRSFAGRRGLLGFDRLNNRVGEFRGAGGAAYVAGEFAAVSVNLVDGVANFQGCVVLAEMAQHQQSGSQYGGGIGDVLSGDVGSGTMYGFKNGTLVAEIRSRDQT